MHASSLSLWLADLRIRHAFVAVGQFNGPASIHIDPEHPVPSFHYALKGTSFVTLGAQPSMRIDEGDFLFTRQGVDRIVWSDTADARSPRSLRELFPSLRADGAASFAIGDGGDERTLVGGGVCMESGEASHFIEALPAAFCIRRGAPHSDRLRAIAQALLGEATDDTPGANPVAARLAEVAVILGVRSFASTEGQGSPLLQAARDPRLGRALEAIHRDPAGAWTIARLGRLAGMSRSGFAAEFTEGVGETPAAYVARARMARAERLLLESDWSLPRIAEAVGYRSAAAFSVAFKRLRGLPPSDVRKRREERAESATAAS